MDRSQQKKRDSAREECNTEPIVCTKFRYAAKMFGEAIPRLSAIGRPTHQQQCPLVQPPVHDAAVHASRTASERAGETSSMPPCINTHAPTRWRKATPAAVRGADTHAFVSKTQMNENENAPPPMQTHAQTNSRLQFAMMN